MTTLHFSSDAEVEALCQQVVNRVLPFGQWHTPAHLVVAAWVIITQPETDARLEVPRIIRSYNEANGIINSDTSGYHETMTLANLRGIHSFLNSLPSGTQLAPACNALIASHLNDKRWIFSYWSGAVMMSTQARRTWVEPDLKPLPAG